MGCPGSGRSPPEVPLPSGPGSSVKLCPDDLWVEFNRGLAEHEADDPAQDLHANGASRLGLDLSRRVSFFTTILNPRNQSAGTWPRRSPARHRSCRGLVQGWAEGFRQSWSAPSEGRAVSRRMPGDGWEPNRIIIGLLDTTAAHGCQTISPTVGGGRDHCRDLCLPCARLTLLDACCPRQQPFGPAPPSGAEQDAGREGTCGVCGQSPPPQPEQGSIRLVLELDCMGVPGCAPVHNPPRSGSVLGEPFGQVWSDSRRRKWPDEFRRVDQVHTSGLQPLG
jgi:hypothetical protein